MLKFVFLAWVFHVSIAVKVPECNKIRTTGVFNTTTFETLYSFAFDLSVTKNDDTSKYPNTVTLENFTQSNSKGWTLFPYDWSFTFFDKTDKKINVSNMAQKFAFQFPNGQQRYYMWFSYKSFQSLDYYIFGPQVFISDGTFFDGLTGNLWDPSTSSCMNLEFSFRGANLTHYAESCCTNFEYIDVPASISETCSVFIADTKVTVPSDNFTIEVNAEFDVSSSELWNPWLGFPIDPNVPFDWLVYILDPVQADAISDFDLPLIFQFEFIIDLIVTKRYNFNGVPFGEIIRRNGIFLKDQNIPYTSGDPCWKRNSTVPFMDNVAAYYEASLCCTKFVGVTPVNTSSTTTATTTPSLTPVTTSATSTNDSLSNIIGTPCSNETSKSWLDIVFVVDTSNAMNARTLGSLSGAVDTLMQHYSISQDSPHTIRAALVTYATNVTSIYDLNNATTYSAFEDALFTLESHQHPDDSGGSVQEALAYAYKMLTRQKSFRIPLIVLFAAAYNENGLEGASVIANTIKDDGMKIVVVNYDASDNGIFSINLKNISSPGYYYNSSQDGFWDSLSYAFTQLNCVCPKGWIQFQQKNKAWGNYTNYADCMYSDGSDTSPSIAERVCSNKNAVLVSITSREKLDFITDNKVLTQTVLKKKKFSIGLHKSQDSSWKWWGENGTEYPLGNYPPMAQTPNPNDTYGYMWNSYGLNWILLTGNDIGMPYVCQFRACDTEYICNLTQL